MDLYAVLRLSAPELALAALSWSGPALGVALLPVLLRRDTQGRPLALWCAPALTSALLGVGVSLGLWGRSGLEAVRAAPAQERPQIAADGLSQLFGQLDAQSTFVFAGLLGAAAVLAHLSLREPGRWTPNRGFVLGLLGVTLAIGTSWWTFDDDVRGSGLLVVLLVASPIAGVAALVEPDDRRQQVWVWGLLALSVLAALLQDPCRLAAYWWEMYPDPWVRMDPLYFIHFVWKSVRAFIAASAVGLLLWGRRLGVGRASLLELGRALRPAALVCAVPLAALSLPAWILACHAPPAQLLRAGALGERVPVLRAPPDAHLGPLLNVGEPASRLESGRWSEAPRPGTTLWMPARTPAEALAELPPGVYRVAAVEHRASQRGLRERAEGLFAVALFIDVTESSSDAVEVPGELEDARPSLPEALAQRVGPEVLRLRPGPGWTVQELVDLCVAAGARVEREQVGFGGTWTSWDPAPTVPECHVRFKLGALHGHGDQAPDAPAAR